MPGYVTKALQRFRATDLKGANSPIVYVPPRYGAASQLISASPDHADAPVTPPSAASAPSRPPPQLTLSQLWTDSSITFRGTNSESRSRSRAGGIHYFGFGANGLINGAVEHLSVIIPTVVSSAAEAEYAALFINGREGTSHRTTLEDLGYPQPPTTIICDNTTAQGIATKTMKQKRSKAGNAEPLTLQTFTQRRIQFIISQILKSAFSSHHPIRFVNQLVNDE